MATTYNFTDGSITGVPVQTQHTLDENQPFILRHIVDFSKQTIEAGASDVAQCLIIPAGTTVLCAWLRSITAETANGTVDLGYGGNPDEWGDALAVDTAVSATAASVLGAINDWVPVWFAVADTIDLTATTDTADVDIDGYKCEVCALCIRSTNTY